jgi:hypothetical protein
MKRAVTIFAASIVLLVIVFLLKDVILGGSYVSPTNAPIEFAASKALASNTYPNYLPIAGKDFTISNIRYFYGGTWVVVNVAPLGATSDSGILVLHEVNGTYQNVLGPSNSFRAVDLSGLPPQIQQYLTT